MEEQQELIKKLVNGDDFAFQQVFLQEQKRCFHIAYGVLFQKEEAQDVVQESFLKFWKHRAWIDVKQGYSRWLYRCVVNTSLDALRRKKRNPVRVSEFEDTIERNIDRFQHKKVQESEFQEELSSTVEDALALVDEKYRMVLILRFWEKMSYKEISKILEIPVGTAGRRFTVGLEKLEKILKQKQNTEKMENRP